MGINKDLVLDHNGFICVICKDITENPVRIMHHDDHTEHLACRTCVEQKESMVNCPVDSKPITDIWQLSEQMQAIYNKLVRKCSNEVLGCMWAGPLMEYPFHSELCSYAIVECQNFGCFHKPLRKDLGNHLLVCDFVLCPAGGKACKALKKDNIEKHLETVCPFQMVECLWSDFGCKYKGQRQSFDAHEADPLVSRYHMRALCKAVKQITSDINLIKRELNINEEVKGNIGSRGSGGRGSGGNNHAGQQVVDANILSVLKSLPQTDWSPISAISVFTNMRKPHSGEHPPIDSGNVGDSGDVPASPPLSVPNIPTSPLTRTSESRLKIGARSNVEKDHLNYHAPSVNLRDSDLIDVVKRNPSLQSVDISGCFEITDKAILEVAKCTSLQSINFSGCREISDKSIIEIAQKCTTLRDINLSGCKQLTDWPIIEIAQRCTYLQSLNISFCNQISDWSIIELAQRCTFLQQIDLRHCAILTSRSLYEILQRCGQLQDIKVDGCTSINSEELKKKFPSIKLN